MAVITQESIEKALRRWNAIVADRGKDSKLASDLREKQLGVIRRFARNQADLEPEAIPLMEEYINIFADTNRIKEPALEKLKEFMEKQNNTPDQDDQEQDQDDQEQDQDDQDQDDQEQDQDDQEQDDQEPVHVIIDERRKRSVYPDANQEFIDNVSAAVMVDMGLIKSNDYYTARGDTNKIFDLLCSVPKLNGAQQQEFSERLVDRLVENEQWFNLVPPSVLARAYTGTKQRLSNATGDRRDVLENRLGTIGNRIDQLTDEFAGKYGYYFADQTNVADVYDGYTDMFNARRGDVDQSRQSVINQNQALLDDGIKAYDDVWGLGNVDPNRVDELEPRLEKLTDILDRQNISDETMSVAGKYKFLDADGNVIPQFIDKDGNAAEDWSQGCVLDANGRLSNVVDLARHDVVKKHVANLDENIDDAALGAELNDALLYKLFQIDTADKVVQGALEHPDQFTNPEHLNNFVEELASNGGKATENGYQAAMEAQVNQTMGFAGRLKSKLKNTAGRATGFFKKLFKPIEKIDARHDKRFEKSDKSTNRQKRVQFFVRMLTGFANAFLTSAAITTIAAAAAAMTGVSLAASLAVIGVVTSIGVSVYQIHKWRKAQQAEGRPTDIKAVLQDKRMMASLGTSALASIAMCFGAAGFSQAATALGFGALGLGGANNTISTYKDAKAHGFSTTESLSWALGNAIAVVAGGITGRATANWGINQFNAHNPENTIFQNKEVTQQEQTVSREETRIVYKDGVTEHAREIAESWYRNNPTELQNRVDMINQYNAQYGTNIDPYRAIVLSADAGGQTFDNNALHIDGGGVKYSGGQHTVLTDAWGRAHDVSSQELSVLRNMFNDGALTSDEMNIAMRVDPMVSANNEVGYVDGRSAHYDGVLHQNAVDANGNPIYTTYTDGSSVFENQTVIVQDNVMVDVTEYQPVNVPYGVGMIGQYFRKGYEKLKDRMGTFLDKIKIKKKIIKPEPPQPPVPPKPKPKPLPPHIEPEPKPLPPHIDPEPKPLPPHIEPEHEPVLRIKRADAKKLLKLPPIIERIQKRRHSGVLAHVIAEELKRNKKTAEQELRTVKNNCAWSADKLATDEELAIAVEQVFLREALNGLDGVKPGKYAELEKLQDRLARLNKQKEPDKHDVKSVEFQIARLEKEILDLESRLIPDEYFVDAQRYIPEYKRKSVEKGVKKHNQKPVVVKQKPVTVEQKTVTVKQKPVVKQKTVTGEQNVESNNKPRHITPKDLKFTKGALVIKQKKPEKESYADAYRKLKKKKQQGLPVGYQTISGNDM